MSDQIPNQQPRLPVVKLLDADNPNNLLHHHHHHHQYETATPTGSSRNPSEVCTSENRNNCTTKYSVAVDTTTYGDERPPRLPPRPPRDSLSDESDSHFNGIRKYVIWCVICGTASTLLGCMFGAIHFFLRSYTSSVGYFETIPMFVPAILLIATGLCIIGLAKRQNRCNYLIKISRASSLTSALVCAVLTFTTATIHMTKLQALQECQYSQKTRTCMCISTHSEGLGKDVVDITGFKLVFDANADCSIVHGALYSCLRAVFGLSVFGVFLEVFICMLVHQLLSHERKKIYWEQLELRCRSLGTGIFQVASNRSQHREILPRNTFGLCENCSVQQATISPTLSLYWRGQTGNFYSPNPSSDEMCRGADHHEIQNLQRNRLFNWPWSRAPREVQPNLFQADYPMRYAGNAVTSADSQYGFASNLSERNQQNPYSVIFEPYVCAGPPPPYSNKLFVFSNAPPSSQSNQSNCPTPSQTYFSCNHSNHSNSSFVELSRAGGGNQPSNLSSSTRENCSVSVSDIEGDAESPNNNLNHHPSSILTTAAAAVVVRTPRQNISNLITELQVDTIRRDCESPENEYHELNFAERELEKKNRVKTLAFGFDNSAFQSTSDQSNWRTARND